MANFYRISGICAVLILTLFFAARELSAEYRAVLVTNGTMNDQIAALSSEKSGLLQPGGARSIRDILASCARVLTLSPKLKADAPLASVISDRCHQIAKGFLASSPRNGRALAIALLTSEDIDASLLRAAQVAAPFEPWPLNVRLKAVAAARDLPAEIAPLFEDDLHRAMLSAWGKEAVAEIYITKASLRPSIRRAAEDLSPEDQRDFLGILRRIMRDGD